MSRYFIFSLIVSSISAQDKKVEQCIHYKFVVECPMYQCDILGNIQDTGLVISEAGSRFITITMSEEYCIVKFVHQEKQKNVKRTNLISRYSKYYLIKKADFDYKASEDDFKKWGLAVGNVIAPIKLRMTPFTFSKDFSIGPTFGVKFSPGSESTVSYNFLSSFGVTGITLDDYNTNDDIDEPQEVIAFTLSLGIMIEHKAFQFGIFSGIDLLNSNNEYSDSYIYNSKPWVSFGFGYSIFNSGE
ncbi:MAG: hypothetical protein HOP11_14540 [Saprospiraceae bacterium]|nr:hypothetical protein [Saprospiraceae bacterium]